MKNNEQKDDVFDELLRDALASDAAPSEDFTARLMEQVRRTPQEKPLRKQPVIKLLAAVAACAVIAVAIPLVTGGMGSSAADQAASADSAAPEAAMNNADDRAGGDNQMVYSTFPNTDSTGGAPDDGLNSQLKQDEVPSDNENLQTLTLAGQDAKDAKAALDAMDIQPAKTETDRYIYVLTEQQAQELGRTVDALYGVEGSLTLILEVTE
mgnify:FL=1